MAKTEPFEKYPNRYDNWFEKYTFVYQSEVNAVKEILPDYKKGIELGVGTGRFAEPLNIKYGIDPSYRMRQAAKRKGIAVFSGAAEKIPFKDETFDMVLMVTTLCFLDDVGKAFGEVYRILQKGGYFINGFVDKNSKLGKFYQEHKDKSPFYRIANFYSVLEVVCYLKTADFNNFYFKQTIFQSINEIKEVESILDGYGIGSFVVVRAQK